MKTQTWGNHESRSLEESVNRFPAGGDAPRRGPAGLRRVEVGRAMHLGPFGGELAVVSGRVWLTRSGDLGDHVLEAGERLRLGATENAVIEPWVTGQAATVCWTPWHASLAAAVFAEPVRVVAFLLRRSLTTGAAWAGSFAGRWHLARGRTGRREA